MFRFGGQSGFTVTQIEGQSGFTVPKTEGRSEYGTVCFLSHNIRHSMVSQLFFDKKVEICLSHKISQNHL